MEFSLHCILNIFSAESLSVGICMGLYDYQYFKPKKKVLEKMEEQFKMFFQSDFTNFFRYDLMTFPNGI